MTRDDIRTAVIGALRRIAPEADAGTLDAGSNLRDELDLDSMDYLNFILALHDRLGVDIPEVDYPRLSTLEAAVDYLSMKMEARRS